VDPLKTLLSLQQTLPRISENLNTRDSISLCQRILRHAKSASGTGIDAPDDLANTLDHLEKAVPGFKSSVRSLVTTQAEPFSDPQAITIFITKEVQKFLLEKQTLMSQTQDPWLGSPELRLFERLSPEFRERAARIRDWCEERLEFMHSRGEMRYYTSHGIGHSKRVLSYGIQLAEALGSQMTQPFCLFAIYVCSYIHDIGLMLREGEAPDDQSAFKEVRKNHGRRAYEEILGNKELGIFPSWKNMGFDSEAEAITVANIAAVHQRRNHDKLVTLPNNLPLFSGGTTLTIPFKSIAAFFRLVDTLDCHERRLPPSNYIRHPDVSDISLLEYVRHEIVEEIKVQSDGESFVSYCVRVLPFLFF